MSIRIYALAKELKVDNKALMDMCTDVGISIKGSSALASLSDEDAAKIRQHLSESAKKPGPAAQDMAFHAPEPSKQAFGKIPTLSTSRPKKSVVKETVAEESQQAPDEEPVETEMRDEPQASQDVQDEAPAETSIPDPPDAPEADIAAERQPVREPRGPLKGSSPKSTPLGSRLSNRGGKPQKSDESQASRDQQRMSVTQRIASQAELDAPVRPDFKAQDPMGNFPSLQKARTIRRDDADAASRAKGKDQGGGKPASNIRLAPVPTMKQPLVQKKREQEAQQPVIRLTPDVLSGKSMADPRTLEQVEQEQRTKRDDRPGVKKPDATVGRDKGRVGDKRPGVTQDDTATAGAGAGKKGKGKFGKPGEAAEPTRDARLMKNRRSRGSDGRDNDDGERVRWRKPRKLGISTAAPRKNNYILHMPLTIRSFSEELGLQASKVLGKLLQMGMMSTINDSLDADVAQLLADDFGIPVDIRPEVSLEDKLIGELQQDEEDPEKLMPRPPVVTFLGHVDHGKTSLLDRIIGINVVSGEKGGITQHIRAYNIKRDDKSITFVDTPGHEAFTEMRARGANVTDIAVIVVAADDGVMPQTEEAISHARAAEVPIIVALNKIDLPGVNEPKILQELASNNLLPAEWGGDVEVVRCSALTGEGIDHLLDMMLTLAELHEYKANPDRPAVGVCLEASQQAGHGVVAKLLVRNGTLKEGDVVVCGTTSGRVKVMFDTLKTHKKIHAAGPAIPVNMTGLDTAPGAGDQFFVVPDIADARKLADQRAQEMRHRNLAGSAKTHVTLEGLFDKLGSDEVQRLNVIIRADVRGSIEAIKKELEKLDHDEVKIHILQATVGGITEADVQLADAADAIIVGFNVVPDENARVLAEQKGVQVRRYDIIYQLTSDIRAALEGMLKPEQREKELGRALVQKVFTISRVGSVAGCRVLAGSILRDSKIRIIRDNRILGVYPLDTLKRERDDAKEVREGYECGIKLSGFNDIKEGDILEAYQIESVARKF